MHTEYYNFTLEAQNLIYFVNSVIGLQLSPK